jgi:hypothetical protein
VPSGRKERPRDWLHAVEVNENDEQPLGNSREEDYPELSKLSSDFDIIKGTTEGKMRLIQN